MAEEGCCQGKHLRHRTACPVLLQEEALWQGYPASKKVSDTCHRVTQCMSEVIVLCVLYEHVVIVAALYVCSVIG